MKSAGVVFHWVWIWFHGRDRDGGGIVTWDLNIDLHAWANKLPKNQMQTPPRVAAVFSEVLGIPIDNISDETSPENTVAWDSLNAMNLVTALENAFNVRLSTKEIVSMRTVGIVRKVLRTKGVEDA